MHGVTHAAVSFVAMELKAIFKRNNKPRLKDTFRYSYTYIETYISLIIDKYSVMAFVKHTYLHA